MTEYQEKNSFGLTINHKNTIILLDLHGVVFEFDWPKIIDLFKKRTDKWWILIRFLRPELLLYAGSLLYNQGSWIEFINYLQKKYPQLMQYIPLIKDMFNQQKPIKPTIKIIKELKEQGYQIDIASNIGRVFFEHLQKVYPAIFSNFNQIKIISGHGASLSKKPSLNFFREYIAAFNSHGKHIVFIDNHLPSVRTAQKLGMIGIHYETPDKLKKQLQNLDILPTNS